MTIVEEPEPQQSPEDEEPDRLRPRTRQATRDAVVPPPIPDRPNRQVRQVRPELEDEDLFPKKKSSKDDEDHQYKFKYQDGTEPLRPITHLYRFAEAVRVVDLDLRPGRKANRAATNGYYFDRISGKRLYLQPTTWIPTH